MLVHMSIKCLYERDLKSYLFIHEGDIMRLLLLAFFIFSSAKALAVTPEEVLNWSGSDFKLSEIFKSLNLNFDLLFY